MKNTMNKVLAAGLSMTMLIPSITPVLAKNVDSARDDSQSTQVKYEVGSHYKWTIHSAIDFGADAGPNSSVSKNGNQVNVLENVIPEGKYLNISVKGDGADGAFTLTNGKTEKLPYDVTDDAGDVAVNGNVLSVPSGTNTAAQNMNFKLNTKKATAEIAGNYDGKVIYNAEVAEKKKEKSSKIIGTVWDMSGESIPDTQFANAIPEAATAVAFTDEVAPEGVATTDLTVAKDGDVVGWLDGTTWKISTQDSNKAVTFNENCALMFTVFYGEENNKLERLTEISFDNVDTSNVTMMSGMFEGCSSLTSLDLSGFDTSNVTDMNSMFHDCSGLVSLNLSNFDTSNVTDMMMMFDHCSNLTQLDLTSFDTRNVTNITQLFYKCIKINAIYVGNKWDTQKVIGYETTKPGYKMFGDCTNLPNYDPSCLEENHLSKAHTGPGGYLTLKQ